MNARNDSDSSPSNFRCSLCKRDIPDDAPVFLEDDRAFCSKICRRRQCSLRSGSPAPRQAQKPPRPLSFRRKSKASFLDLNIADEDLNITDDALQRDWSCIAVQGSSEDCTCGKFSQQPEIRPVTASYAPQARDQVYAADIIDVNQVHGSEKGATQGLSDARDHLSRVHAIAVRQVQNCDKGASRIVSDAKECSSRKQTIVQVKGSEEGATQPICDEMERSSRTSSPSLPTIDAPSEVAREQKRSGFSAEGLAKEVLRRLVLGYIKQGVKLVAQALELYAL